MTGVSNEEVSLERKISKKKRKTIKNYLKELRDIALSSAIMYPVDWVIGFNVENPLNPIAMGSGLNSGLSQNNTTNYVTSLGVLSSTMIQDALIYANTGDPIQAMKGAAIKIIAFGGGLLIGDLLKMFIQKDHNKHYQLSVSYEDEADAKDAYRFLDNLIQESDYLLSLSCEVSKPKKTNGLYNVYTKIRGKSDGITKSFIPAVNNYFEDDKKLVAKKDTGIVDVKDN